MFLDLMESPVEHEEWPGKSKKQGSSGVYQAALKKQRKDDGLKFGVYQK